MNTCCFHPPAGAACPCSCHDMSRAIIRDFFGTILLFGLCGLILFVVLLLGPAS